MNRLVHHTFLTLLVSAFAFLSLAGPVTALAQAPPIEATPPIEGEGADGATPSTEIVPDVMPTTVTPGPIQVDADRCQQTNTSLWISVGSIHAGALLLFLLLWWIFNRKNWLSPGFPRFSALALPLSGATAVALGMFRPEAPTVNLCLLDSNFQQLILFGQLPGWLRGVALGFAPSIILLIIALIALKMIEKIR